MAVAPASRTSQAFSPLSPPSTHHRIEIAFVAQAPRCANFRQHLWQKLLPAKSWVDGHHQNNDAKFQHILDQ